MGVSKPEALPIGLAILAGGMGRRVGGADKGLLEWRGQPMIDWILHKFEQSVAEVVISANRNLDTYQTRGWPVVQDLRPNYQGPLAGIEAAWQVIQSEWLLVLPCDTPCLPPTLPLQLWQVVQKHAAPLARPPVLAVYAATHAREHPSCCLLHRKTLETLQRQLDSNHLRWMDFVKACNAQPVMFDEESAFANLNSTESL